MITAIVIIGYISVGVLGGLIVGKTTHEPLFVYGWVLMWPVVAILMAVIAFAEWASR